MCRKLAASVAEGTQRLELAQAIKKHEPQVYLALNGIMNGFKGSDEEGKKWETWVR